MKYFNSKEFTRHKLIKLKRSNKLSVGLGIPVLNEEATLKRTISVVKEYGDVIDRLIVIDSGSTDDSIKICKKMGVEVVADEQTASELGYPLHRGKGWNLWSSLYYLNTDIVAWIDSDIQNFNECFFTGIIGPLLKDPRISFVKGYYHRPKGDARVTELMARPFMNTFFPEIIDVIQPLSGEYGGKRKFFENINFFSGYSVEMALLIEAFNTLKRSQVAQSHLGVRIHALQEVAALGRMSASILNTMITLAEKYHRLKVINKNKPVLYQFLSTNKRDIDKIGYRIDDVLLPPIIKSRNYVAAKI